MSNFVIPLKQISPDTAVTIYRQCDENAENIFQPYTCGSSIDWDMVVVNPDANNAPLCDAVLVTDQHVIVTRECIIPHIKALKHKNMKAISVVKRSCLLESSCKAASINVVAWSYSHLLAIVQFDPMEIAKPVCFVDKVKSQILNLRGYEGEFVRVEKEHSRPIDWKNPFAL
ncbi:hypothetical protein Ddc_19110 [Ditylenchus destructor]|nr:hypothetical protein Ddc_19110 [Ditylenchus destructor]